MDYKHLIKELSKNKATFKAIFSGLSKEEYLWKPAPQKWCLLEIICHLYDEEREDFRARTKLLLENPEADFTPFDPEAWVKERKYMEQDFHVKLEQFLKEREQSIAWLQSLENPKWSNAKNHVHFGKMTAKFFLSNWLAHDYLHIRQILKLKFDHLKYISGESLVYAGKW